MRNHQRHQRHHRDASAENAMSHLPMGNECPRAWHFRHARSRCSMSLLRVRDAAQTPFSMAKPFLSDLSLTFSAAHNVCPLTVSTPVQPPPCAHRVHPHLDAAVRGPLGPKTAAENSAHCLVGTTVPCSTRRPRPRGKVGQGGPAHEPGAWRQWGSSPTGA